MQVHFHANQSHFHKHGFAFRLALKQRHKGTLKWPIRTKLKVKSMQTTFVASGQSLMISLSGRAIQFHTSLLHAFGSIAKRESDVMTQTRLRQTNWNGG